MQTYEVHIGCNSTSTVGMVTSEFEILYASVRI